MWRIVLLGSVLLLSAVWAAAQYGGAQDSARNTTSSKTTIQGCLNGAAGNYTLTDYAGASYQLTGDLEQLKAHVGETVQLTGVVVPVVNTPAAMSEGTNTQPTVSVISIKRISGVCGDTNNIP